MTVGMRKKTGATESARADDDSGGVRCTVGLRCERCQQLYGPSEVRAVLDSRRNLAGAGAGRGAVRGLEVKLSRSGDQPTPARRRRARHVCNPGQCGRRTNEPGCQHSTHCCPSTYTRPAGRATSITTCGSGLCVLSRGTGVAPMSVRLFDGACTPRGCAGPIARLRLNPTGWPWPRSKPTIS